MGIRNYMTVQNYVGMTHNSLLSVVQKGENGGGGRNNNIEESLLCCKRLFQV